MNINETLNCPQCRGAIPKLIDNVKIAGCPHCGGVATMGNDGFLRRQVPPSRFSVLLHTHQEPFVLGSQMQYDGVDYNVFAIYLYRATYTEFDEEDNKWTGGDGYVTEWYAKNSRGDKSLIVTSDTDKKFYIVYDQANNQLVEAYKNNFIEEGTFQLTSFAGVDDEPLDGKGFYRVFKNDLSLESTQPNFDKNTSKAFFSQAISSSQVKRMHVIAAEQKTEAEEDFNNITFYRNLFAAALSLVLCLMLFNNTFNPQNLRDKSKMVSETVSFEYVTLQDGAFDTTFLRPQMVGVFNLKGGKNYQFYANGSVSGSNSSADFSASIIRQEDKISVWEIDIAFFTESGTDNEGRWTENVLFDDFKFHVDKTGKYEVWVSPDYDDLTNIQSCSLTVYIHSTGYYTYYLMVSGFFFLALVVCQWQRENIIAFANLPEDTFLHDLFNQ